MNYRPQDYGTVVPMSDCLSLVQQAVAAAKAAGEGTVEFPYFGGGGYLVSDAIVVDFDNCTIVLDDNITLGKTASVSTQPFGLFRFIGVLSGNTHYLQNVQLRGRRKVQLDCNGRNATGYTYVIGSPGDTVGVAFIGCTNAICENIYAYNGLTGCISTSYCPGMLVRDCDVSDSQYDNGLYGFLNAEHIVAFDDNNPATWGNQRFIRIRAWNCRNHGVGSYGSVGMYVENPKIWNCGNNVPITGTAGSAGCLGVEFDGTNYDRDHHFTATDVEMNGCY